MDSVFVWFVRHFSIFSTNLLCDDGRDGVGVTGHPRVELQQVLDVDWLLAHQGGWQRIRLIRYRRHLSAAGGFENYVFKLFFCIIRNILLGVRFILSSRKVLMDLNV